MSDTPSFTSLYQQVPTWRAEDEALWRLAREYHERTEAFDERYSMDRRAQWEHAKAVRTELLERSLVWPRDLDAAIRADHSFESDWRSGVRHFVSPITHPLHTP